jgi:hypothetical protein
VLASLQAVISHFWSVDSAVAAIFGASLAYALVRSPPFRAFQDCLRYLPHSLTRPTWVNDVGLDQSLTVAATLEGRFGFVGSTGSAAYYI